MIQFSMSTEYRYKWSLLYLQYCIYIFKQFRPWSEGSYRSPLILVWTFENIMYNVLWIIYKRLPGWIGLIRIYNLQYLLVVKIVQSHTFQTKYSKISVNQPPVVYDQWAIKTGSC